jgi:hypothetical protein
VQNVESLWGECIMKRILDIVFRLFAVIAILISSIYITGAYYPVNSIIDIGKLSHICLFIVTAGFFVNIALLFMNGDKKAARITLIFCSSAMFYELLRRLF